MKSIILIAMLIIGIASCETPKPATGNQDATSQSTSGTDTSMSTSGTTRPSSTGTDTTTKRDSLPR